MNSPNALLNYATADQLNLFQSVIDGATDSVVITDASLDQPGPIILYVNRAFCRMTGYTAEEVIGKATPRILQGPATDRQLLRRLRAAMTVGDTFRGRTVNYRKDSTPYYVEWSIIPAFDAAGKISHFISFQKDVTQEEVAHQQAQQKEELYRMLARVIPNSLVILFDRNLRCVVVEGVALEQRGVPRERLEGLTFDEILPPERLPFFEEIGKNALNGETTAHEVEFNHHLYAVSVQPIPDESGEIFTGMLLAQDITEHRQVQEQLNERVQQLTTLSRVESELGAQLNIDYVLMMALDSAVRLSRADAGYIALLDGDNWETMKFIGSYPEVTVRTFIKRGMGTIGRVVRQQQAELIEDVNTDPDYISVLSKTCSIIVVPLISRDKLIGILSVETSKGDRFTQHTLEFTKLTMARVAQAIDNASLFHQTATQLQELQALYERVSKLEQLKTDMIRIASHDLRNPLSVILSYGTMLKRELDRVEGTETAGEYVDNIEVASQQMRKIILNILSLERIEEAAKETAFDLCNLREVVEAGFKEQRSYAQLKSHRYKLEVDVQNPIVRGDMIQLNEAITNLIGNAIKYTPDGKSIRVSLKQERDRLIFQVVDNGYGIKEAQQGRLFQPFFRARTQETRHIEGTGLGLHLVKNIVERHEGEMIFHSVYGEGSTFGFELKTVSLE